MNGENLEIINEEYIVQRSRISNEINNKISFNKILYVFAPIGHGKTIAVRNYFNEFLEKNTWHEFKEEDNDIYNFIMSLIKTVANVEDINSKRYYNMANNTKFKDNIKTTVDKLASVLIDDGSRKFIVFDDLQVINDEFVKSILMHFISISPKNYKFIFLSRRKVPAYFCDFIANRQIEIINSSDLDFNEEDINEFYLREGINLYSDDIKDILLNTGGWAAGMSTILMYLKLNNESDIKKILQNNEYMNIFLNKNVWDTWDDKTKKFFMKISLLEDLDIEECIEITGVKDSKDILENYIKIKNNEMYEINPMFLKFLKEKSKSLDYHEKVEIYKKAGECFERRGLNLEAAEYYHNAGEIEKEFKNIEKFCDNGMVFKKINTVEKYIKNISKEVICKNHILCNLMIILEYINYRLEESEKWYKRLLKIKEDIIRKKEVLIIDNKKHYDKEELTKKIHEYDKLIEQIEGEIAYICLILPSVPDKEIKRRFYEMYERGKNNIKFIHNISLTLNLPSMLRGIRDTSNIWNNNLNYEHDIDNILPEFYGIYGLGMAKIASAEFNYEKNKINLALMELTKVIARYGEKGHIDNIFVAYMILYKIMCANGNTREAKIILYKISKLVDEKNASYLMNNINATYIRFDLLNGNVNKAREWNSEYVNNNHSFNLVDTYQYMTKARIYISSKQYKIVNTFLEMIYRLNYDYKYTSNIIECCILQAIALNKDGDEDLAFSKIEEALKLAQPLGYIRIFADEGEACHDVLNKYLRSDKLDKDIDIDYIKKILSEARKFAEFYPKYLKVEEVLYNVNLTKSEIKILKLIYKGMSNVEISEYLNIKKDTVKFHVRNIYSKLNVKNRMQAVQMANEIGIMKEKRLI